MDPSFLNRNVNEGFSGGEKKRNEILQLAVLEVRALCVTHTQTHTQHRQTDIQATALQSTSAVRRLCAA